MYITRFVVEGRGHFPVDMLRYDTCWPSTQRDVSTIEYFTRDFRTEKPRRVALSSAHKLKGFKPTNERWSSFGWVVIEISEPQRV